MRKYSRIRYFLLGISALASSGIHCFIFAKETNIFPYYILLDTNTGNVIEENYPDYPWNPASLTKLMTTYVVFSLLEKQQVKLNLNTPIFISKNATRKPPASSTLKQGSIISLDNALKILIVKSANDIAVAIAESLCKTEAEFVKQMNYTATKLGLNATNFTNSHGVIEYGHYTTARDIAILSQRIKSDFPQYAHYFKIKGLDINGKKYPNTNWAIGIFPGANGMKTGFTCASGFNIVVSASRDKRSFIAVILGAENRNLRNHISEKLLSTGFSNTINRKRLNYIIKNYYRQNLSNNVPDISEKVCTTKNESINYSTQIQESKDKAKYFNTFDVITLLENKKSATK
ncbi:MAG: D-alanyl-D-alanine carboxypeptidase [Candidatus Liberibacter europaeus]|uniref:D-alanyl-D-alanine carboxypeptidase n=1 Tax=Candidatus Liberibacter europaeus TaxID=744859 RepID=A0A2T4VZ74_9HYPH|nr:D-alanyl-D-alanine carboxypeptidase [Candidatus Liberibacter europaeus]PTL87080.1 MAG: D-alanyl-D-alanine carboxypeptidase [Candidatus Liberibacter europaeus]